MTDFPGKNTRAKALLAKCLIASFALHSVGLYLWSQYPIGLKQCGSLFLSSSPLVKKTPSQEEAYAEADLDGFFEEFFIGNSETARFSGFSETSLSSLKNTKPEPLNQSELLAGFKTYTLGGYPAEDSFPSYSPPTFDLPLPNLMIPDPAPASEMPSRSPKKAPEYHFPSITSENFSITPEEPVSLMAASPFREPSFDQKSTSPPIKTGYVPTAPRFPSSPDRDTLDLGIKSSETPPLARQAENFSSLILPKHISSSPALSDIDTYLPTQTLYTMQWNDNFTVTPSFFRDDGGYVFSIAIAQKPAVETAKVKQNIYFLIDISSEIESHKVTVFKRSVIKALSSLSAGDSFNIFLLDKKIIRLSPHNLPFSFNNLRVAEAFLEKSRDKAFFSSFDLLKTLEKTLDSIEQNDELHTAVLLSNGKLSKSTHHIQKSLCEFLEKNQGKLTLFTAAVGKNNDLVHLDMLSSLSGGKLFYSETNASLPRKLGSFMKTLHAPVAKDVHLSVRASDPKAEIVLLPRSSQLAHLYHGEPFVVMGKINRLCDLQVNLEGKSEDGWILLTKDVNFSGAEEAPRSLKQEWAVRQVSSLYREFLQDPKSSYLEEAGEILKMTYGRALGK